MFSVQHVFRYLFMTKAAKQLRTQSRFIPGNTSGKYEEAAGQLHTWDRVLRFNEPVLQQGTKIQGSLQH